MKIVGISFIAALMIEAAGAWLLPASWPPLLRLGVVRLVEIGVLLGAVGRRPGGLAAVGLSPGRFRTGLWKGSVSSAALGAAAGLLFVMLRISGINVLPLIVPGRPVGGGNLALLLVTGGVIGPVAEEIFFRGMVFGYLRRWGFFFALTASTLLFVLPHTAGSRLPLVQAAGGIVFAAAYEREQSLLAPMVIHCLGNLALFILAVLA